MENQKLRFALCGVGDFGLYLTPYINEVAEVVAVCDPNPESRDNFKKATGLQIAEFEGHEQLLAEVDIDAVAVMTSRVILNLTRRCETMKTFRSRIISMIT